MFLDNASKLKRKLENDELVPRKIVKKGELKNNEKKTGEITSKTPKMSVTPGKIVKEDAAKIAQREAAEEKRLAIMMMHKKDKHLYDKIVYGQKRKKREVCMILFIHLFISTLLVKC